MADVLVLGGGFGGAAAALAARGALGEPHTVTLVDRQPANHLCGANPLIVVGREDPANAERSLPSLEAHGVQFLAADVEELRLDDRAVATSAGMLEYDYLVVALGAAYDWDAVPGSAAAHSFYDLASTLRLKEALARFEAGRIVIGVAGAPIKCPPAPFEAAMTIDAALRRRGLRDDVAIDVAIPEPAPMGVAGPEASALVRRHLDDRDLTLHTSAPVHSVVGNQMVLGNGTVVPADLPVVVPRHVLPGVVAESGLADGKAWVPVDVGTLETAVPGVFAVGDVTVVPAGQAAIPKAGVFAAGEGRVAGAVIAARVLGLDDPPPYDGTGHCFLAFSEEESALVGGDFLADGGPQVGLAEPSAAGMAAKHRFTEQWRAFEL